LATGGMAERVKFMYDSGRSHPSTLILFFIFWIPLVYCPIAHWHWMPNGWLSQIGVLDHAGGNVVHVTSGTTALVFSIFMKKRRGSFTIFDWLRITINGFVDKIRESRKPVTPVIQPAFQDMMMMRGSALEIETPWKPKPLTKHSLPFVILGTGLLWFGWFGFNGGSFGAANIGAAIAITNTHLAAVVGAVTYQLLDLIITGKPKILTGCFGAIIGMVMITPAAGYVHPGYAVVMGFLGSLLTPFFILLKSVLFDDTLDAAGIHLASGFLGSILTGVFASKSIYQYGSNDVIAGGWVDGNWIQVPIQLLGFVSTFAWTFVMTTILFMPFLLLGWNVTNYEERVGLDYSQHGESAYMYEPPEPTIPYENETVPKSHIDLLNVWKEKIRYWWVHRGQVSGTTVMSPTMEPVVLQNPHDFPLQSMNSFNSFRMENIERPN
jgi:Amt family ammonium transporter